MCTVVVWTMAVEEQNNKPAALSHPASLCTGRFPGQGIERPKLQNALLIKLAETTWV